MKCHDLSDSFVHKSTRLPMANSECFKHATGLISLKRQAASRELTTKRGFGSAVMAVADFLTLVCGERLERRKFGSQSFGFERTLGSLVIRREA